jgi:hypothetical protein
MQELEIRSPSNFAAERILYGSQYGIGEYSSWSTERGIVK